MKRFLLSLALVVATALCMAQNSSISVSFVGKDRAGTYKRLSTVVVENLSRGWSETLVYPDTIIELSNNVGIDEAEASGLSIEGYPNPFGGNTMVSIQMSQSDDVQLLIYDLSGRKVAEQRQNLPAGRHAFRITLREPQVYMLVATTSQGHSSLKLLNQAAGETNAITDCGILSEAKEKLVCTQNFVIGDFMRYTGYIISGNDTSGSTPITQQQNAGGIVPLVFADKPVVVTGTISNITGVTADCGGEVTSDGGAVVYYRGVCWSTSQNPTTNDSRTTDGPGTGTFTSNLTNLTPGTTYYVRAYATNTAGTSYGNQISFTTPLAPTITTSSVTNVGVTTAQCGGIVTNDGGAAITARGVCWSTSPAPTTSNSTTFDSTGAGAFVSMISGLTSGTTYYIRAYASNIVGTSYGAERTFTTKVLPTVQTVGATNVVDTTATFSGNVLSHGDSNVIVRGFCWGPNPNPDFSDNYSVDSNGLGAYSQNITTLSNGTGYYMRAYATSALGTAYGQDVYFTTLGVPLVITDSAGLITTTSAVFGGQAIFDGGDTVRQRGFCWSTFPSPTVSDNVVIAGRGLGSFRQSTRQLNPGTVYYVRAFATNRYGTGYGNEIAFSTVNPAFSVSDRRAVGFSTGNLQYNTTGQHLTADSTTSGTWRFAPNQYDTIGHDNSNISSSYAGWIDLFGWGTSGSQNRYPYLNTCNVNDYDNGNTNLQGTSFDWGTYNAILNGGNQTGEWFTMTKEEWQYLLNTRDSAAHKYGLATVCGVPGVILLPDDWRRPSGTFFYPGHAYGYNTNTYNQNQWSTMESYGAIFLPAAGQRTDSTNIVGTGLYGQYWTASSDSVTMTHFLSFASDRIGVEAYRNYQGKSVRLVRILKEKPSISTDSIMYINSQSAVFWGKIENMGRNSITSYGFCVSTSPNPTTADNVVVSMAPVSVGNPFRCQMNNLMAGTKYYLRAYATNGDGTTYGPQLIFTTLGNGISGRFSVSATTRIRFAHGNLQYAGFGTHIAATGDTLRGQWQFAYNQYDLLGAGPNSAISDTNTGWIDLFGWGTSGYQRRPHLSANIDTLYGNDSLGIENTYQDWGEYVPIYSPLLDIFFSPGDWRSITHSEIQYLLTQRPSAANKAGLATIDGVPGMILIPDTWVRPVGLTFNAGFQNGFAYNVYTPSQWAQLQSSGVVFLPAAGLRDSTAVNFVRDSGVYWTSTSFGVTTAGTAIFNASSYSVVTPMARHIGAAVRLVKDEEDW